MDFQPLKTLEYDSNAVGAVQQMVRAGSLGSAIPHCGRAQPQAVVPLRQPHYSYSANPAHFNLCQSLNIGLGITIQPRTFDGKIEGAGVRIYI